MSKNQSPGSKPLLHQLVHFFYERTGVDGIVCRTRDPQDLIRQYDHKTPLFIVEDKNSFGFRKAAPDQLTNVRSVLPEDLDEEFLRNKIYLQIGMPKSGLLNRKFHLIERACNQSMLSIVSAPARGRSISRLARSLARNQSILRGKAKVSQSVEKREQKTIVGGRLVNIGQLNPEDRLCNVLAIVPVFNERDILGGTLEHLLQQGVDVHIIDNWSTDGSYELVESLARKSPDRITYERFPSKRSNEYDWTGILKRVTEVAYQNRERYDWVTLNDADEIRWSPWKDITLQAAFSFLDRLGYNCIDYTVFNFRPTRDGFTERDDPLSFFEYGEFGTIPGYFVQVKSWKNNQKADLASSGGHHVLFPGLRVFPLKFLLCHYPLRSNKQGRQKIFRDRNPRFKETEKKQGWHTHYLNMKEDASFIYEKSDLVRFDGKGFMEDYLYERIAGIGVERSDE